MKRVVLVVLVFVLALVSVASATSPISTPLDCTQDSLELTITSACTPGTPCYVNVGPTLCTSGPLVFSTAMTIQDLDLHLVPSDSTYTAASMPTNDGVSDIHCHLLFDHDASGQTQGGELVLKSTSVSYTNRVTFEGLRVCSNKFSSIVSLDSSTLDNQTSVVSNYSAFIDVNAQNSSGFVASGNNVFKSISVAHSALYMNTGHFFVGHASATFSVTSTAVYTSNNNNFSTTGDVSAIIDVAALTQALVQDSNFDGSGATFANSDHVCTSIANPAVHGCDAGYVLTNFQALSAKNVPAIRLYFSDTVVFKGNTVRHMTTTNGVDSVRLVATGPAASTGVTATIENNTDAADPTQVSGVTDPTAYGATISLDLSQGGFAVKAVTVDGNTMTVSSRNPANNSRPPILIKSGALTGYMTATSGAGVFNVYNNICTLHQNLLISNTAVRASCIMFDGAFLTPDVTEIRRTGSPDSDADLQNGYVHDAIRSTDASTITILSTDLTTYGVGLPRGFATITDLPVIDFTAAQTSGVVYEYVTLTTSSAVRRTTDYTVMLYRLPNDVSWMQLGKGADLSTAAVVADVASSYLTGTYRVVSAGVMVTGGDSVRLSTLSVDNTSWAMGTNVHIRMYSNTLNVVGTFTNKILTKVAYARFTGTMPSKTIVDTFVINRDQAVDVKPLMALARSSAEEGFDVHPHATVLMTNLQLHDSTNSTVPAFYTLFSAVYSQAAAVSTPPLFRFVLRNTLQCNGLDQRLASYNDRVADLPAGAMIDNVDASVYLCANDTAVVTDVTGVLTGATVSQLESTSLQTSGATSYDTVTSVTTSSVRVHASSLVVDPYFVTAVFFGVVPPSTTLTAQQPNEAVTLTRNYAVAGDTSLTVDCQGVQFSGAVSVSFESTSVTWRNCVAGGSIEYQTRMPSAYLTMDGGSLAGTFTEYMSVGGGSGGSSMTGYTAINGFTAGTTQTEVVLADGVNKDDPQNPVQVSGIDFTGLNYALDVSTSGPFGSQVLLDSVSNIDSLLVDNGATVTLKDTSQFANVTVTNGGTLNVDSAGTADMTLVNAQSGSTFAVDGITTIGTVNIEGGCYLTQTANITVTADGIRIPINNQDIYLNQAPDARIIVANTVNTAVTMYVPTDPDLVLQPFAFYTVPRLTIMDPATTVVIDASITTTQKVAIRFLFDGVQNSEGTTLTSFLANDQVRSKDASIGSRSCDITNGTGQQTWHRDSLQWLSCTVASCDTDYHAESNACVSNTQSCDIANGTGEQTWTTEWGACTVVSCDTGYHSITTACELDVVTQSCTIANGTGEQTWDAGNSQWGSCIIQSCDTGYHLSADSTSCDVDTIACTDGPYAGTQTWDTGSQTYGACSDTECAPWATLQDGLCTYSTSFINGNRVAQLSSYGSFDSSYGADVFDGEVYAVAVQSDGKTIIGGSFTTVNGVSQPKLARLNTDGTLDTSFTPGAITGTGSVQVQRIAIQSDGKILIAGYFNNVGDLARGGIARLNSSDGSNDITFAEEQSLTDNNGVDAMFLQSDGSVYIGGYFTSVNGIASGGIARLDTNGMVDTSFSATVGATNAGVLDIAVQGDGKVVIGGSFTTVNTVSQRNVARLNTDGSLDESFTGAVTNSGDVVSVAVDSSGNILMGGWFSTVNSISRSYVARFSSAGVLDSGFNTPDVDSAVYTITPQSDGTTILGGYLTHGIVRVASDGSKDQSFIGQTNNGAVYAVAVQSGTGDVLVGGSFTAAV